MKFEKAEPGIFATEATKNALHPNTLDALRANAPEGEHVIVMGVDDIFNGKATPDLLKQFNEAVTPKSGEIIAQIMGQDVGKGVALSDKHFTSTFVSTLEYGVANGALEGIELERVEKALRNDLEQNIRALIAENACFITIPMEGGNEPSAYGSNYNSHLPQGNMEGLLAAKPGRLDGERVPGTAQDLQIWVAHHEAEHCLDSDEYAADTKANHNFALDVAAGRATDPEFAYYNRTMRAAGAITQTQADDYVINGLTPLAGEQPLTSEQQEIAKIQVVEARTRIYDNIIQEHNILPSTLQDPDNARMNARLAYKHADTLNEQGMFDDIPYGKETVERFMDGAQRYAQDYYAVPQKDRINTAPDMTPQAQGHFLPNFAASIQRHEASVNGL
jgi:hypothetical protein